MKTKLLLHYLQNLKWSVIRPVTAGFLLILALGPEPFALSQIPQGFNYQAIARDGSGNPIISATLQVKIGILSDTIANTMVWEELFNPVKTNAYGMFTIVVGTGVKQSGSALTFSAIDWTKTPLFLRTSIVYPIPSAWKVMGTTKLQSVPYSMVAGNLEGTVPLLSVKGNTTTMDSALFVVRNNTGQIVFAVYNEGVRIYVDDGLAKGSKKGGFAIGSFDKSKGQQDYFVVTGDSIRAYIDTGLVKARKGGFAIGSFDKSKAGNEEYFRVTRDSTRVYIDDTGTKRAKGGFAIGGFDKSKSGNTNFLNVSTDASGTIKPSQNRILWYPIKNAFLTGKVLIEKPDSVGVNSFASGFESKAKGQYSQALGYKAIARGDYSTAIGKNALANKINSFAFGESAEAANLESYAIGRGAIASGYRSFAFGSAGVDTTGNPTDVAHAIGDYSFAIGQGSKSIGRGSISIGIADTAKGDFSVALGYESCASGVGATSMGMNTFASVNSTAMGYNTSATSGSTAMGTNTKASGDYSTAMGNESKASGKCSTAMGYSCNASAMASTAMGWVTWAVGYVSTAMGVWTYASGVNSTAIGYYTTASGDYSTAMGNNTTAPSGYETAIGIWNTTYTPLSTTGWNASDRLFVIGNGTSSAAKSNALIVYKNGNAYINGNLGIGTQTPGQKLDIIAGNGRVQSGYNWLTNSDVRYKKNIYTLEGCLEKVIAMRGVSFDLISDSLNLRAGNKNIGFIAQELENVVPEVVVTGSDGYKSVAYDKITAVLTEAIKEQQKQIEGQQKQIESDRQENQQLKSRLQSLQEKVDQIEALMSKSGK